MSINKCKIGGIVAEEPRVCSDSYYKEALEIVLDVNRNDIYKFERIKCLIIEPSLIDKAMDCVKVGDYFLGNGRLISFECNETKVITCPHCGKESTRTRRVIHSDIVMYEFEVSPGTFLPDSEGINSAVFSGVIPNPIAQQKNRALISLVINRPMKAQEELNRALNEEMRGGTERYNLVRVHGYKDVAESIKEHIHQKDRVFVKGAVCERTVQYPVLFRCHECGEKSEQYIECTRYEVVARCVDLDNQYIPNFNSVYANNSYVQMA